MLEIFTRVHTTIGWRPHLTLVLALYLQSFHAQNSWEMTSESWLFWFWLSSLTDLPGLDWDLLEGIIPNSDSKWCSLPHLLQELPCAGHSFNLSACLFLPQPMHLLPGRNLLGFNRDCPPVWLWPWFHVPFLDRDCKHPLWLLALKVLCVPCPEPFFFLEWYCLK